jgi:hypothetical protein
MGVDSAFAVGKEAVMSGCGNHHHQRHHGRDGYQFPALVGCCASARGPENVRPPATAPRTVEERLRRLEQEVDALHTALRLKAQLI